jgi:NAD(P)-dependent dehydrogenase (short-subunit alcohol dehydrogenase family)
VSGVSESAIVDESMSQPAVLITGASGGIGRALVKTFSEAGYAVIATDISPSSESPPSAHFVAADLARTVEDELYAEATFADIRQCLNGRPLKALINNAATQILGDVNYLSRTDWRTTMDVNLLAPFFWTQAFVSELQASAGCVVNVSSIHARLTKPRFSAYATSKAALSALTRSLAIELGGRVRVNAIEPAAIDTPMLRAGFEGDEGGFRRLESYHPSGCVGAPEQLGQLALMLVEARYMFLNGAVIPFDGGIGACLLDPRSGA